MAIHFDTITSRLHRLSGKLFLRIVLIGVPALIIAAGGLALITFGLDFWLKTPQGVRGVFLALSLAVLCLLSYKRLLLPLRRKPGVDELALLVEANDPSIKSELISAVQLERDLREGCAVESPELIEATVTSAASRFEDYSFSKSISLKPALRPIMAAAAMLLVVGGLAAAFPQEAGIWVQRQLLLQSTSWPRETTLEIEIPDIDPSEFVQDGDTIVLHVPERTPLQIQVRAIGKLPEEVELVTSLLETPDREQGVSMGRAQGKDYFQHIFPPLQRSIRFYARGGDDEDRVPVYEVRVATAPRIVKFWADYEYPEYTAAESRSKPDVNISAPEGTRINMHFELNLNLASFSLEFESSGEHTLSPDSEGRYHHSFVVTGNDFYWFRLRGANGVSSPETAHYVVTAEIDQEPRILVERPSSLDISVTPEATLPLKGVASDDYGITAIAYRYGSEREKLDSGGVTLEAKDLMGRLGSRQLPFFKAANISAFTLKDQEGKSHAPREGDRFFLSFLVEDNRHTDTQPEPHRVFGDYGFSIQVLSPSEVKKELAQQQYNIKSRVRRLATTMDEQVSRTRSLIASIESGGDGANPEKTRPLFFHSEQEQQQVSYQLEAAQRQFGRVFDGYLWNRLDPGQFTDKLIAVLSRIYRQETGTPEEILGQAIKEVDPLITDSQAMGKLTRILQLLLHASIESSPQASRFLSSARLTPTPGEQIRLLGLALGWQVSLQKELAEIQKKLQAWEEYLDLVQDLQELNENWEGVTRKLKKLSEKK